MAKANPQQISREQLLAVIAAIEFACTILKGLLPILRDLINRFDDVDKILEGK